MSGRAGVGAWFAVVALLTGCMGPEADRVEGRSGAVTHSDWTGEYPYVGTLSFSGDGWLGERCTGTLVGRRTVLTSASCVEGGRDFEFELRETGRVYEARWADEIRGYPSWDRYRVDFGLGSVDVDVIEDDFAILHLESTPDLDVERGSLAASRPYDPFLLAGAQSDGDVEETRHDEAQLFDDETIWLGEEYTDSDEGGTAEQEDLGGPTFARVGGLWGLGGSETIVAVHSFTLEREGRIPYPITVDVRVDDELSAIVDAADGDVCIEGEHETNDVDVLCAGGDNEPECGNGRFEEGEQCDDGNTRSGDGCSRSCVEEEGWICRFEPSECVYDDGATAECGNGRIEVGEECDDGNYRSGDGCSDRCYEERGWTCRFEPSDCESNTPCGNGRIDSGEECDDGNTSGGDGCSSGCFVERGWACRSEPSVCSRKEASVDPRCGDHWIDAGEECDDGNTSGGDGCSAQCNEEEGWSCAGQPSRCVMVTEFPVCGDGLIEGDEQCDDFGRQPGDGCDGACRVEDGWVCEGEPSRCQDEEFGAPDPNTPTCGDGRVNEGEQCDDGNTVPGDGCSAVCQVEEGWFCEGAEPSRCEMRRREREEDLEGTDSSGPTSTTACAAAGSLPRSSVPSFLLLGGALVALRRRRR